MPVLTIRFDSGINTGVDARQLPPDRLRSVKNARLTRDGQLRIRPGYTALAVTSYPSGTLAAHDLVAYQDRLLAFGSGNLFELVPSGAKQWRRFSLSGNPPQLPQITNARELARPQDPVGGTSIWSCAASAGFATLVWSDVANDSSQVLVVRAETDTTILAKSVGGNTARALALSDRALVTYRAGSSPVRIDLKHAVYASAADFTTVTGLFSEATDVTDVYEAQTVIGADQFVVAVKLSSNTLVVKRFTSAGVVVVPVLGGYATITSQNATSIDVYADASADRLVVAWIVSGTLRVQSYVLSTGAVIGSPPFQDATFNTSTPGHVRLAGFGNSLGVDVIVDATTASSFGAFPDRSILSIRFQFTGVFVTGPFTIPYAAMAGRPLFINGDYAVPAVYGAQNRGSFANTIVRVGTAGILPELVKDFDTAVADFRGTFVQDASTGKYYWSNALLGEQDTFVPQVTEFDWGSTERRQTAQLGNLLYIAGGMPSVFDGRGYVDSGFGQRPVILGTAVSNGAGNLSHNANYDYRLVWEWTDADGNLCRSAPSAIGSASTGASDDTVTLTISGPWTYRFQSMIAGSSIRASLYRTVWDTTDGKLATFHLTNVTLLDSTDATKVVTDLTSDATLASAQILYTQIETVLEHHAPPPSDRLGVGTARIVAAGQPRRDRWTVSKPLQPGQPVQFAVDGELAFSGRITGEIEACITIGSNIVLFTRREVWLLTGQGPNIDGVGEYFPEQRLLAATGMRKDGWRSICETPEGVFFQLDDSKIYLFKGGAANWVGFPVQDRLDTYPIVVASTYLRRQQCVAFALQSSDATTGTLLLYDLRRQIWLEDDIGLRDPITGLAEYQGRLALASGGIVYLEDLAYGSGPFVPLTLQTGSIAMTTTVGTGAAERLVLLGVYQGDCTVTLSTSYDDGRTYPEVQSQDVLATGGYAAGDPVELEFVPPQGEATRIAFQLDITHTAADSAGPWLSCMDLHYSKDDGPARLGDARRR